MIQARAIDRKSGAAFTLVETLASITVLVLLIVMVTQLTNSAAVTTTTSRKHMDADSQARMLFDRMSNDFERMLHRKDVDYVFTKQTGNDAMYFYSETVAYYDNAATNSNPAAKNSVALVGYRVNANLQLERLGKGLTWDGGTDASNPGGIVFLTTSPGSATPLAASTIPGNWPTISGTDPDFHVLAEEAYRLEIAFLLTDGTVSSMPILSGTSTSGPPWPASGPAFFNLTSSDPGVMDDGNTLHGKYYAAGSRWYNTSSNQGYICADPTPGAAAWNRIGVQDISAIIVGIAILDSGSRNLISNSNGSTYSSMVSALADTPANTTLSDTALMAPVWLGAVTSGSFAASCGISQAAASQVRVYQRYFYLASQ